MNSLSTFDQMTDGEEKNPDDGREKTRITESVRQALLQRHRYSLRLHIFLGFFLVFLFAVGVAVALVYTTYQVEQKLQFLETVNDYMMEVEQARRFEKNFFLYGTNLNDALENIYQAKKVITRNAQEVVDVFGKIHQKDILVNLGQYEALLEQLAAIGKTEKNNPDSTENIKNIELELRKQGQQMVSLAEDLLKREKKSLSESILRSRHIHFYSLVFLLVFLILNAYILGSRILRSIGRFTDYAKRIAEGNLTPITPTRRFRDEFTDLAIAINYMIQELEKREAILIQSHKMRAVGTLTAGIAHELNNPLNNITITAHMFLEDYSALSENERMEMINDIIGEAGRSKSIISNLLDFARESGSHLEPLDLKKILQNTISLAANQIRLSGIKIEFNAADNLPRIHGDNQQLCQVFLNLILNAIDASEKGSRIQIMVMPADEPNYVAVKVIDSGKGIPRHILGSIFDPFFTTKPKGKGTGLGLSVSQGIIAKHGGRINVTSTEAVGSSFTVILPVTTIPAEINFEKSIIS